MEILKWIENWFSSNCDGEWEHENQIIIQATSNPGWHITIDLNGIYSHSRNIEPKLTEVNDDDWYGIKIENGVFTAAGDPSKLEFLLNKFKHFIENENI